MYKSNSNYYLAAYIYDGISHSVKLIIVRVHVCQYTPYTVNLPNTLPTTLTHTVTIPTTH